jgi:hypothetical protein
MPLSLKSRFSGSVCIIQCRGRIVAGDEVKSLEAVLDMASEALLQLFQLQPQLIGSKNSRSVNPA